MLWGQNEPISIIFSSFFSPFSTSEQYHHMSASCPGNLSCSCEFHQRTAFCCAISVDSLYGLQIGFRNCHQLFLVQHPWELACMMISVFRDDETRTPRRFGDSAKGHQPNQHLSQNENSSFGVSSVRFTGLWCLSFLYKRFLFFWFFFNLRDLKKEHIHR